MRGHLELQSFVSTPHTYRLVFSTIRALCTPACFVFQGAMAQLVALQFSGCSPPSDDPAQCFGGDARKQAAGGRAAAAAAARSGGAIWALDGLLEPVAVRFCFHFEEERPTNRVDREFSFRPLSRLSFFLLWVGRSSRARHAVLCTPGVSLGVLTKC